MSMVGDRLSSPRDPPRLQVARGVSPALPHGRIGPSPPSSALSFPLLQILVAVLGVPLPESEQGLLATQGGLALCVSIWARGTHILAFPLPGCLSLSPPTAPSEMGCARPPHLPPPTERRRGPDWGENGNLTWTWLSKNWGLRIKGKSNYEAWEASPAGAFGVP